MIGRLLALFAVVVVVAAIVPGCGNETKSQNPNKSVEPDKVAPPNAGGGKGAKAG